MSFGFHYFETTNQSLTLQYFSTATSPLVFGRLRSLAAATSIVVGLLIFLMDLTLQLPGHVPGGRPAGRRGRHLGAACRTPPTGSSRPSTAGWSSAAATPSSTFSPSWPAPGARSSSPFRVFLLVKVFHCSVTEVTLLFVVNNAINYVLSPAIGRAIVRFGERRVLSVEYGGLIGIFLVYAFSGSKSVVIVMYILDHILFNFAIAIRTYFQKVADPGDIAPSMAVGFTINHIAAVVMPAIGGALWMIDYRIPFIGGAVLSLVSLVAVQRIPSPDSSPEPAGAGSAS